MSKRMGGPIHNNWCGEGVRDLNELSRGIQTLNSGKFHEESLYHRNISCEYQCEVQLAVRVTVLLLWIAICYPTRTQRILGQRICVPVPMIACSHKSTSYETYRSNISRPNEY
jgi:hypothetical protein